MPNQDGSGPKGKGPKTGRKLGNCDGEVAERPTRKYLGRRRGHQKGGGRRAQSRN